MIRYFLISVVLIFTSAILFHVQRNFFKYGYKSFFPELNIKNIESADQLKSIIKVRVTKRSDLFQSLGIPSKERAKGDFYTSWHYDGKPWLYDLDSKYRSIVWEKYVGFYFIISISSATRVITVYIDDEDVVQEVLVETQH